MPPNRMAYPFRTPKITKFLEINTIKISFLKIANLRKVSCPKNCRADPICSGGHLQRAMFRSLGPQNHPRSGASAVLQRLASQELRRHVVMTIISNVDRRISDLSEFHLKMTHCHDLNGFHLHEAKFQKAERGRVSVQVR